MACMKVALVMLTILPPALSASACEKDGSCPVTTEANLLLQTRSNTVGAVSISQDDEDDRWGKFAHYMDYTMQGMGNSILIRADGFNNTASNFDGTMPGCYDVCMAQTEPPCLAFTFASPVWHLKQNRWCLLHKELAVLHHRNEFMLGFPSSRRVDLSSDGAFFLQRLTRNGKVCLAEVGSHFDSIDCDAANPKQKWYRDVEGIYINNNTNHCISNKDGNIEAVVVPGRLAGEPLINCARKFYTTSNPDAMKNFLFLEHLDSYDVPDGENEASWDGTFRKFWEPGPVREKQGRLSVKHSMAHVQQYDEVHTLE